MAKPTLQERLRDKARERSGRNIYGVWWINVFLVDGKVHYGNPYSSRANSIVVADPRYLVYRLKVTLHD